MRILWARSERRLKTRFIKDRAKSAATEFRDRGAADSSCHAVIVSYC